jgi:hypothetical protein
MTRKTAGLLIFASIFMIACGLCLAATVETEVKRVALFKNGLAFFIREGKLPEQPGAIEIGPLPAASHGTFWIGWDPSAELNNLAVSEVEVAEIRDALNTNELLRANIGKKVRLEFPPPERQPLEGKILLYVEPPEVEAQNPYMAGIAPPGRKAAALLLVEEKQGAVVAINPGLVERIVFAEELNTTVADKHKRIAVSGHLLRGAGKALSVSYLAKGLTWAPSYLIDITDPDKARLTAKAVIINEIEDLRNAEVELITGFPNLEFSEIISPLAKKEDLASFLQALGRGHSQGREVRRRANVMQQRVMMNVGYLSDEASAEMAMPAYGSPDAGVTAEDLFYYPLEKVSLDRGATGYYPLFSVGVEYEHLYAWDIPDYLDAYNGYQEQEGEDAPIVWHSLRLQNDSGMPWTTAPAETMQNERLLGQSTLTYTPADGESVVKITQALGLKAGQVEIEISNEPNAYTYRGDRYDRVTVEGTLNLRSYMTKEVTVEITKLLTGTLKSSSREPELQKIARPHNWNRWWHLNPHSKLSWKVAIGAGEALEIKYSYEALIRH